MAEYRVGARTHAEPIKAGANWREIYERNPWLFVASAFAGGLLIAAAASSYRRRGSYSSQRLATAAQAAANAAASAGAATTELWDRVKGPLLAAVGTQIRRLLRDVIPSVIDRGEDIAQSAASMASSYRGVGSRNGKGTSTGEASSGLSAATGH